MESHRLDHRRQAELLLDRVLSARQASQAPPLLQGIKCSAPGEVAPRGREDGASPGAATKPQAGDAVGFPKLGMRVGIAGPPGAGKSTFIEVGSSLVAASFCPIQTYVPNPRAVGCSRCALVHRGKLARSEAVFSSCFFFLVLFCARGEAGAMVGLSIRGYLVWYSVGETRGP